MAHFQAMQKKAAAEQAALMKQYGLDMSEFTGGYNDPELDALDKKLKK